MTPTERHRTTSARLASAGSILYGGDYNPEQWPEETWSRDMELLSQAGVNEVTLNVFSWATIQPNEDEYDFSKLDRIVDTVTRAGMRIMMATSTGSLPAWMVLRHPDVARVEFDGTKRRHGYRHNHCATSPTYREYAAKLAGKLAERYGGLENLVAWHVNNEYNGFCWCDRCAAGFREWLAGRYGSVEAVNEAWNTAFWGHTYHSFGEIFPPNLLGDAIPGGKSVLPAFSLDYQRWYGETVLETFNEEKRAIRAFDSVNPVTTNFIGHLRDYDYLGFAYDPETDGGVDVSSWDLYPGNDPAANADTCLRHDLYRAVSGQRPFVLMEQSPSRQNWATYCAQKRPGQLRMQSWQAVARGADAVQYFQLKQSRSGCEKFHGAVIGSDGTDRTRTFREVAELGAELARVTPGILGAPKERGRVAFIYDWPSDWGLGLSAGPSKALNYIAETLVWYRELYRRNIPVDFVRAGDDLAGYDAVVAPLLYMAPARVTDALRSYVLGGGRLLTTTMSLLVDEHDSLHQGEAPVPLRDLAGVWVSETDAIAPDAPVDLSFGASSDGSAQTVLPGGGRLLCDVLEADPGTQVLATYGGDDYYAGAPAFTFRPSAGGGGVFYAATLPSGDAVCRMIGALVDGVVPEPADVTVDEGIEISRRVAEDGTTYLFLTNPWPGAHKAVLHVAGRELIADRPVEPGSELVLDRFSVAVVRY